MKKPMTITAMVLLFAAQASLAAPGVSLSTSPQHGGGAV